MTDAQFKNLKKGDMVYANSDNVGYEILWIKDGMFQLCGMPFTHQDYTIKLWYHIKEA